MTTIKNLVRLKRIKGKNELYEVSNVISEFLNSNFCSSLFFTTVSSPLKN